MTLRQIRSVIDHSYYVRNDLAGHTREEFARRDIPAMCAENTQAMRALSIGSHFNGDAEKRDQELEGWAAALARWHLITRMGPGAPEEKCSYGM